MVAAPGKQAPGSNMPLPIYDAKVDGNAVVFKCKSPDNVRTISFTGIIQDDEMSVVRVIEIPAGAATGFESPFWCVRSDDVPQQTKSQKSPSGKQGSPRTAAGAKDVVGREVTDNEFSMEWRCLCPFPYQPLSYRVTRGVGAFVQNPALTALLSLPAQGVKGMTERYDTIDQLFKVPQCSCGATTVRTENRVRPEARISHFGRLRSGRNLCRRRRPHPH